MSWPSAIDYRDALQHPPLTLKDVRLHGSTAEKNTMGVPRARAGGFANVYKLVNSSSAKAVRVFLYPNDEREQRYQAVSDHIQRQRPKCLVDFTYQREGIKVGGGWYPVQTMEWVKGETLGAWVKEHVAKGDRAGLRRMADQWIDLLDELRRVQIAHGDLQHGNVMVAGDAPVLVDYDCMCVPQLVGRKAFEQGMPAYQHPQRGRQPLSLEMDHFAAWITLIALRALAHDLTLWKRYVEDTQNENLLFTEADIQHPDRSPLWRELRAFPDADVRNWSTNLRTAISAPFQAIPRFEVDVFGSLAEACQARNWRQIWELISSPALTGKSYPPRLVPVVEEACKRVDCRARLETAVRGKNLQQIVKAYNPTLLDDWKECEDLVKEARSAKEVVDLLAKLTAARQQADGGAGLIRLWRAEGAKLKDRPEAKEFSDYVDQLLVRQDAWKRFLDAFQDDTNEKVIVTAWEKLQAVAQSVGLPPEATNFHRQRAETASERIACLDRLRSIPDGDEQNDRQFCRLWKDKEAILKGCRDAAGLRARFDAASRRLAAVTAVQNAIDRADQEGVEAEREVVRAAAALPEDYTYSQRSRVQEADRRLDRLRKLDGAFSTSRVSEERLAQAWEDFKATGARLTDAERIKRFQLAEQRWKVLQRLAAIPTTLPAHEQDQQWLAKWQEELLRGCPEAEGSYRTLYNQARRRTGVWHELERALQARDILKVQDLWERNPDLHNYPPLEPHANEIATQIKDAAQLESLRTVLRQGDAGAVCASLDLKLLRQYPGVFQPSDRHRIETCLQSSLQNGVKLEPSQPFFIPGEGGTEVRVRWRWPETRLINHCIVAGDPNGYLRNPEEARRGASRIDAQEHRRMMSAGGYPLAVSPGRRLLFVTLWPVIDLGWTELIGAPIQLGRIDLRRQARSPRGGEAAPWRALKRLLNW